MAAALTDGDIVGFVVVEGVHDGDYQIAGMAALTERPSCKVGYGGAEAGTPQIA
jgi:hypothetical protein